MKTKQKPPEYVPSSVSRNRNHNELARAVLEASKLPANRKLLADIQRLEADIQSSELDRDARAELLEQRLFDLSMTYRDALAAKRTEAARQLERISDSWRRQHDPAARLFRLEIAKTRIQSMSDKEVDEMLRQAGSASSPAERRTVDSELILAAAGRGDPVLAKQALDNVNIGREWLNTDDGETLAGEVALNTSEYGIARIETEASGSADFGALEIRSLLRVE